MTSSSVLTTKLNIGVPAIYVGNMACSVFRSTFRDVLRGVEEGDGPSLSIKFGKESLHLDSWFRKCQYDWFCKVSLSERILLFAIPGCLVGTYPKSGSRYLLR